MRAMILAAGRGERMRPLTDALPKPLLEAGGKPLIVWQVEALARAGFDDIVINHAWLGERIEAALGDGGRFGVSIRYSPEPPGALETAGGMAQALPLLTGDGDTVFLAVSSDIYCDYDYRRLRPIAAAMAANGEPFMHLVMAPNPPFHAQGDFALDDDGRLRLAGNQRLTFANIGLYHRDLFRDISPQRRIPMTPYYRAAVAAGRVSGERHDGFWANLGTPAQLAELDRQLRAGP